VLARLAALDPSTELAAALLDQSVAAGIGNVFKSEICWAERVARANPARRSIELGEHLTDDLRRLVRRQRLAALGFRDLCGKVFDRVHTTDENVAQRLATRVGILERLDGRCHRMIGRAGNLVDQVHRFLATARGRDDFTAIGVLLRVPLRKRFVVATFSGMQHARLGRGIRLWRFAGG
jgi:hypothetical protein